MNRMMSMSEIEREFDTEWVLIEDPDVDEHFQILRGTVLWHSKDRDEVYQKMIELSPRSAATVYVGAIPENTAVVL